MEFKNQVHSDAYERVRQLMTQLYGESFGADEEAPRFTVSAGSTRVDLWVLPWAEESAVVSARAWVTMGAQLDESLLKYLLELNDETIFGAFGLDKEGDIFFEQNVLADNLDKSELREAVGAVRHYADRYDDEIQKRWGGQRLADR